VGRHSQSGIHAADKRTRTAAEQKVTPIRHDRDGRQDQPVLRCRHARWLARHRLTQREATNGPGSPAAASTSGRWIRC
jgi:hypothetical protein